MQTVGIDATNIQGGGGITHLVEMLSHADPLSFGFKKVVLWGGESIDQVPDRDWLYKRHISNAKLGLLDQLRWRWSGIKPEFNSTGCDLMFAPGGTFFHKKVRYVSMSQNMLLYEREERKRFPLGWSRLRYNLLRVAQAKSFRNAAGIVYISQYAKEKISSLYPWIEAKRSQVIYHGIDKRFFLERRESDTTIFKLLYVSRVNFYKHQWNVVEAVKKLNSEGVACRLILVGGGAKDLVRRLQTSLVGSVNCEYLGEVHYRGIEELYHSSDAFVFASTCENMPNILLEAMASGLPIASSNYGPMSEILRDSAIFFDPLDVESISTALRKIIQNKTLRNSLQEKSLMRASFFSWEKCASETFQFLRDCAPIALEK